MDSRPYNTTKISENLEKENGLLSKEKTVKERTSPNRYEKYVVYGLNVPDK